MYDMRGPPQFGRRFSSGPGGFSEEIPEIFKFIMEKGNVSIDEMFNVYNMGVGLVIIADPSNVKKILSECPDSWVIGEMLINEDKGSSVVVK